MKKIQCLILIIAFSIIPLYSQSVVIELSIHQETMYNEFLDRQAEVPMLEITYRNGSRFDIFLNAICNDTYYPNFASLTMDHLPFINYNDSNYYRDRAFNHSNYSNNLVIEIGKIWIAYDRDVVEETALHSINDDFYYMYKWKTLQNNKNTDQCINSRNTDDSRLNLVFLKPGESYTKTFDLAAFFINNGSYEFRLQSSYRTNYINERVWNNSEGCFVETYFMLPETIGTYHRYDDEIQVIGTMLDLNIKE